MKNRIGRAPGARGWPAALRRLLLLMLLLCLVPSRASVILTTIFSFNETNGIPEAGLLQASDGNLYGSTSTLIYKVSTDGDLTALHTLTAAESYPSAALVQGRDGYLYGTTYFGGTNDQGTIFKISTSGAMTILHSFVRGSEGRNPGSELVGANDGNFYGTTQNGGTNDMGTVFRLGSDGHLTTLYSFPDAGRPAGLVQAADGNLYGTTLNGGTNYYGTVFKISTAGALTNLYLFTADHNGAQPEAGLVQGNDGALYGTTSYGGDYRYGTVFRITTNGALTTLYSFMGYDQPYSRLVQGNDGDLYGMSEQGGPYGSRSNCGSIFRVSMDGILTILFSFVGGYDGVHPKGGLVQGADGSFYGITSGGSIGCGANWGTVFRLNVIEQPPVFQAVTLSNQILVLTWSTEAGSRYQLQ